MNKYLWAFITLIVYLSSATVLWMIDKNAGAMHGYAYYFAIPLPIFPLSWLARVAAKYLYYGEW